MKNVDVEELQKFEQIAEHWWDPNREFKPLHNLNPIRVHWINQHTQLNKKTVLDIGCGGGILTEAMATQGALVTGIDISDKAIQVAQQHAADHSLSINYQTIASIEDFAQTAQQQYDVITCMELLEHLPNPQSAVHQCAQLLKKDGWIFFSTLNRNLKSYLFAIIGAEYLLKLLPRGTHDYEKFIRPSELSHYARSAGLSIEQIQGVRYHPLSKRYTLTAQCQVNYLLACRKYTEGDI